MKYPIWKPILIVLVLAACGWMLANKGLKYGIDLQGGTTLLYQVNVPEGANAKEVIDETIAVLADRVDPAGVMNLTWKQMAGNRIEIQMPQAKPEVQDLRQDWTDLQKGLTSSSLQRSALNEALALSGEERAAKFEELAAGNDFLLEKLNELGTFIDNRPALETEYLAREQAFNAAQLAYENAVEASELANEAINEYLESLREEPTEEATEEDTTTATTESSQSEVVDETPTETVEDLTTPAPDPAMEALQEAYAQARSLEFEAQRAYQDAYNAMAEAIDNLLAAEGSIDDLRRFVLTSRMSINQLNAIAGLPTQEQGGQGQKREEAIAALIEANPDREDAINEAFEAYTKYDAVRGPLDDPQDLIQLLRGSGVLEFRVGMRAAGTEAVAGQYRNNLREQGPSADADEAWQWYPIRDLDQFTDYETEAMNNLDDAGAEQWFATRRGIVGQRYGQDYYVLLGNTPARTAITQDMDNWEVSGVSRGIGQDGFPTVNFSLNPAGAQYMTTMTKEHQNEPMAILLDGKVITSPNINDELSSSIQISGDFTDADINYMIRSMKAGSLDAQLSENPISQKTTGPAMGQENLNRGKTAALFSIIAVAIFMLLYYFFPGGVAVFALGANMVIILGILTFIDATFTLPGIAGIVLTIGMAVDANVLIFERIREETDAGRDLPNAVRLGYEKALSTILDANITTLITCIVLGYTATTEIKGFAMTLGVGILATLFTALFCTKVILDTYVQMSKARQLVMLPTVVTPIKRILSPNVNWLSMRYTLLTASAVLMVLGWTLAFQRGADLLDIEFRAGTQVSMRLADDADEKPMMLDRGEVEQRVHRLGEVAVLMQAEGYTPENDADQAHYELLLELKEDYPETDFALFESANIVTEGETDGAKSNGFAIASLITNDRAVTDAVTATFSDVLERQASIDFAQVNQPDIAQGAPVHRIYRLENGQATLGMNVQGLAAGENIDVTEFVGGLAIVLEDLSEPISVQALEERIGNTRLQPQFQNKSHPEYQQVIGLELAEEGDNLYSSLVYLVRDSKVNYVENFDQFENRSSMANAEWDIVHSAMQRGATLDSVTKFSSQVSDTMKTQAITAMSLSLLAVVVYIWFRFGSFRYGLAAILALIHDVSIALGLLALSGMLVDRIPALHNILLLDDFKINLAIIAALLTIVGYSLNDTIVVFDRVRENRGRMARATASIINDSINQTISRTILTSGTTLLALVVLYIYGGPGVHGFAFAMLGGVLVGTYSSIAIASPTLLLGAKNLDKALTTVHDLRQEEPTLPKQG